MTVGDALGALRRRWPVLLLGLLLTLLACLAVSRTPGVYWSVARVNFLAPESAIRPNQLAPDDDSTIAFAGIIQTEINGGVPPRGAVSPDVTLVDEGIYDGWSVRLPDTGGQWATNFADPCLLVQASGPSQGLVQSRMDDLIARIKQLAAQREDAAGDFKVPCQFFSPRCRPRPGWRWAGRAPPRCRKARR